MSVNKINLNSDLGEHDTQFLTEIDIPIIRKINSANVSCLFHGGDKDIVEQAVFECQKQKVSIGAHTSFFDRENFGRKAQSWNRQSLHDLLDHQIQFMINITNQYQLTTTHLKPHGALNSLACRNQDLAYEIASYTKKFYGDLIILAPALSQLAKASQNEGLLTALEVYADRTYESDGTLTLRNIEGSVISDPQTATKHLKDMITKQAIISREGLVLKTPFHSICLHSDTINSVEISKQICILLDSMNIEQITLPNFF